MWVCVYHHHHFYPVVISQAHTETGFTVETRPDLAPPPLGAVPHTAHAHTHTHAHTRFFSPQSAPPPHTVDCWLCFVVAPVDEWRLSPASLFTHHSRLGGGWNAPQVLCVKTFFSFCDGNGAACVCLCSGIVSLCIGANQSKQQTQQLIWWNEPSVLIKQNPPFIASLSKMCYTKTKCVFFSLS